jgi:hypothetical protein
LRQIVTNTAAAAAATPLTALAWASYDDYSPRVQSVHDPRGAAAWTLPGLRLGRGRFHPEIGMFSQRSRVRGARPWMTSAALLCLFWVGCDDGPTGTVPPVDPAIAECGYSYVFKRGNFAPNSHVISNRFLPLVPGEQFIFQGVANRGGGLLEHRVIFTVTGLTKTINGVRCAVMWDRDYNANELKESELAFFAQDKSGNVINMGEYPEEYENGVFIGAPSTWITGLGTAQAGINVPGETQLGFTFLQGWVPDISFLDCGQVYTTGSSTCVPFNCYENVLVVDEWSPIETGHQRKYYAPGVGSVRVGAVDDPEGETLGLVNLVQLEPRNLEEANLEALKLEARAYTENSYYAHTPRMERLPAQ